MGVVSKWPGAVLPFAEVEDPVAAAGTRRSFMLPMAVGLSEKVLGGWRCMLRCPAESRGDMGKLECLQISI